MNARWCQPWKILIHKSFVLINPHQSSLDVLDGAHDEVVATHFIDPHLKENLIVTLSADSGLYFKANHDATKRRNPSQHAVNIGGAVDGIGVLMLSKATRFGIEVAG